MKIVGGMKCIKPKNTEKNVKDPDSAHRRDHSTKLRYELVIADLITHYYR